MPETLGNQYRDKWRTWAYKARDCLAQMDPGLQETLEAVASQSTELTPEYIQSLNISPEVNASIKRFLVHKLDGDPAEVVRNASKKHGLEQYRLLAQLCDPTVSGRNWNDARWLYHPSPASSIASLPAKIAEWKNLEIRLKARSGETMPTTLRTLALINLCPPNSKRPYI